ncbi:fluoride efflux transporter FluC [Arthrobacter glacialis]|uniref:fluoride efflux transporter FluC n=1 Tax=Arthrobacter glacialis TaxID=1664 RepID=UPI001FAEB223|nr:CrcB family protein [Arthrobacter glacialis]
MSLPFLRPQSLGWVALGGTLGAGAREALILGMPDVGHVPWAIVLANIVGAFLLGLLYSALSTIPQARAQRTRRLRLLLGTGFCGGFTTYSTLALGVVVMAGSGGLFWATAYALGTVLFGALATWAGIAVGILAGPGAVHRPLKTDGQR